MLSFLLDGPLLIAVKWLLGCISNFLMNCQAVSKVSVQFYSAAAAFMRALQLYVPHWHMADKSFTAFVLYY